MTIHQMSFKVALLGSLVVAIGGCGGDNQQMPMDMTVCVELGLPAKSSNDCCDQGNLTLHLDDLSRCCAGLACCNSTNHSHHVSDTACSCDDGYEWTDPRNDTSFQCKKLPPIADLAVDKAKFHFYSALAYPGSWDIYVCINRDPNGNVVSTSDGMFWQNKGNKSTGPYEVDYGIVDEVGLTSLCSKPIQNTVGTASGTSTDWATGGCCKMSFVGAGKYRAYFYVDSNDAVVESNEDNNKYFSPLTAFTLP